MDAAHRNFLCTALSHTYLPSLPPSIPPSPPLSEQLREMLDFYVEADVFRVSADRTMIELFNTD
jgi:hypothetical protein